jgi:hypothetical protein
MSTPLYDALVTKVRDWSNRDTSALPDSRIKDSLQYASENAYRELRIQGMEKTFNFVSTDIGNSFSEPSDLKEYISVRNIKKVSKVSEGTTVFTYTASTNQSLFRGEDNNDLELQYTIGAILVTLNGVFLTAGVDFSADNGISVNLTTPAYGNDIVSIVTFNNIVESTTVKECEFIATAGQTVFTGSNYSGDTLSYTPSKVLVTINGIFQTSDSYTATDGVSITLALPASQNDVVTVVSYNQSAESVSNAESIEVDTLEYQRADYRSFVNRNQNKYSSYLYSTKENKVLVNPKFNVSDSFEIVYYSDGSDLGTEYPVNPSNFALNNLESSDSNNGTALYFKVSAPVVGQDVASSVLTDDYTNAVYFRGKEQPHYLRDSQEQLLIYLALSFINDYLGETNESTKYETKAAQLIQRLLNEEVFKKSSGGNIRINFEGPLI